MLFLVVVARCVSFVARGCYSLGGVRCSLFVVCVCVVGGCSLFVVYCLLCVVCYVLLFGVRCGSLLLLVVCCCWLFVGLGVCCLVLCAVDVCSSSCVVVC